MNSDRDEIDPPSAGSPAGGRRFVRWAKSLIALGVALVPAWMFWNRIRIIPLEVGPATTFLSEPLRPDGFVDYAEALNRAREQGITPRNNAAVLLMQALGPGDVSPPARDEFFGRIGIPVLPEQGDYLVPESEFVKRLVQPGNDLEQVREIHNKESHEAETRPWKSGEFPDVARRLETNTGPLRLAVEASERSRFFMPLTSANRPMATHGTPVPIQGLRGLARGLSTRAMLSCGEGRVDDCWRDLISLRRLAQKVRGNVLTSLVAGQLLLLSTNGVVQLVECPDVAEEQWKRFQQEWNAVGDWGDPVEMFDREERFASLDAVGMVVGQEDASPWRSKPGFDANLILRKTNEDFDGIAEAFRKPTAAEVSAELQARAPQQLAVPWLQMIVNRRRAVSESLWAQSSAMLFPAHEMAWLAWVRAQVRCDLVRLAMAVARHRVNNGQYPRTLQEIDPDLRGEVPVDRWSDEPYRYRLTEAGFVVYSIGPDGKDDQGQDLGQGKGDIVFEVPPPPKPAP